MSALARELSVALTAARRAGALLRAAYEGAAPVAARTKEDASPVTEADLAANEVILTALQDAFPEDGRLSEEVAEDAAAARARSRARRLWCVDPMDGTRDFVARTGDFAVHVGLTIEGVPTLGVVNVPVEDATYFAVRGEGAFVEKDGKTQRLRVSGETRIERFRIGVGTQHVPDNVRCFLAGPGAGLDVKAIGASVKFMAIARGALDLALWLHASEKQWDTCAPEVIVHEAGGRLTDVDGAPLRYDTADVRHGRGIVASNGAAHATAVDWVRPWFVA